MKQSQRDAEQIIRQWENRLLEEDTLEGEGETCFSCFGLAEYEVLHRPYCRECARTEFADWFDNYDETVECDYCGTVLDDFFYNIDGEKVCEGCFELNFKI